MTASSRGQAAAKAGSRAPKLPPGTDPAIVAIAMHRQARAVSNAAPYGRMRPEDPGEEEAYAAASVLEDREIAALGGVLTTRPATIAGLLALLDYIAGHPDYLLREGGKEAETFPALLATTARGLIASRLNIEVSAIPAPSEPDPIYAAIERHRIVWAELGSRCQALSDLDTLELNAALAPIHEAVENAEADLIDPAVTTIAGAVELLRYVAEMEREEDKPFHELIDPEALADALEKIEGVQS
jgi:hypothetical protein